MKLTVAAIGIVLVGSAGTAAAEPARWETYTVPQTETSVDIPSSIFSEKLGRPPGGEGQRFQSTDGRAKLTIESGPIGPDVSPAFFLAKQHPPEHIQYKRITPRFFAVSGYKDDQVWYDRCNFSNGFVRCVLIKYPAREERAWDEIVTRISLSLSGR